MPRALVVDDDPQIQKILVRLIRRHGFEVYATGDPINALSEILSGPYYRYVFLDHDLGTHEDGTWIAQRVAADANRLRYDPQATCAVPTTFVVHSANPDGAARMAQILRSVQLRTRVIPKDRLMALLMFYKPKPENRS